ncbi:MAG: hypothetical protein RL078_1207 [Bacteroidota bacterium]|jgi:hypothetical protein
MSAQKGPKTKRVYITLEYYNTTSLDSSLSKLRKELLEGIESSKEGHSYNKRDLHFEFKQVFINPTEREAIVSIVGGQPCELIRSNV